MNNVTSFQPDWASPPGATIEDLLTERSISKKDFAAQLGRTPKQLQDLLKGAAQITDEIAERLSGLFGISKQFWVSRELQYREGLERLETNKRWIGNFPTGDMVRFGWIKAGRDAAERIAACLNFFGVANVADWQQQYGGGARLAAFRTSASFTSDEGALLAWLRMGEILANEASCAPWDREKFHAALSEMRKLTRVHAPKTFIPRLRELCADCGVALVIARAPTGCRASGVTRFVSADKAMLMLSVRHGTDDHLWFTFFHEAGHLVLHDTSALFLEGGQLCSGEEEKEANKFSEDLLIPPQYQSKLRTLPHDHLKIARFAREIGVSPGIVVGQMQHYGNLPRNHMNRLKRPYKWE